MKLAVAVDERGRPLSVVTAAANVAEVTLAGPVLDQLPREVPEGTPVVADRGYDSDPLRKEAATRGLVLVAPHRRGRAKPKTADGRRLRRYKRRWIVERTFAWLQAFRRVETRREYYSFMYHGFVTLACILIVWRRS
jgi:IS5 family transposase